MNSDQSQSPRISIITSSFNCAAALNITARSVREQNYTNIQWIVADGSSKDGTLNTIKDNSDVISHWFSEPDNGIYDAWNKACKFIDGEWVLFLGAGDCFFSKDSLSQVFHKAASLPDKYLLFYGNVQLIKPNGTLRYLSSKPDLDYWEFGRPALPNHQGVFQHKSLLSNERPFDSSYRIAGDSKFLLESMQASKIAYLDIIVSKMVDDGVSNTYQHILFTQKEINRLCGELGIRVPMYHRARAYLNRVSYYLAYRFLPENLSIKIQRTIDKTRRLFGNSSL